MGVVAWLCLLQRQQNVNEPVEEEEKSSPSWHHCPPPLVLVDQTFHKFTTFTPCVHHPPLNPRQIHPTQQGNTSKKPETSSSNEPCRIISRNFLPSSQSISPWNCFPVIVSTITLEASSVNLDLRSTTTLFPSSSTD
ncbi:hypothetical protein ACLOJK_024494 [Asimina triloba]